MNYKLVKTTSKSYMMSDSKFFQELMYKLFKNQQYEQMIIGSNFVLNLENILKNRNELK